MTAALIPAAAEAAEGTAAKAASSGAGKAAAGKAGKTGAGRSGAGRSGAGKSGAGKSGGRTPAASPAAPAAAGQPDPATPAAQPEPAKPAPAGKPAPGMATKAVKSSAPGRAVSAAGAPVRALGGVAENQTVQAGSGFLLGVFAWALGLAYLQHGPAGVKKLLAAKFLNVGSDDAGSF